MSGTATWQAALTERVSELLREDDRVRGLWLSGSLARGDADRMSDLDFVVAVDDHPLAETANELETMLRREFDVVLLRNSGDDAFRLLNLVTFQWERMDFSLLPPSAVVASGLEDFVVSSTRTVSVVTSRRRRRASAGRALRRSTSR